MATPARTAHVSPGADRPAKPTAAGHDPATPAPVSVGHDPATKAPATPAAATSAGADEPLAFPAVQVVTGAAFELIAELAAFNSGPARGSLESGKAWIREVRALAGPELIARAERHAFGVYGELATIAFEVAQPRGVGELARGIAAMTGDAFRRRLLGTDSWMARSMVSDGAIDRALGGDRSSRTELKNAMGPTAAARRSLDRLLDDDPDAFRDELHAIVVDWGERVSSALAAVSMAAIARDAATRIDELATGTGADVLTRVTRGVTYSPQPWIRSIVIVPTVAMRPYIIPTELRDTVVFVCSVADESFETDPAAPPHRLVKVAAALGDERRLRILHLLRREPLTASEIADRLGVDRTSLHHHLGILRSAGLLAIRDEGVVGWRYALRDDGVTSVGPELDAYLRRPSA